LFFSHVGVIEALDLLEGHFQLSLFHVRSAS
jgi:hypothetical protein